MCIVFILEAGQKIPKENLANAVASNSDGLGIVTVNDEGEIVEIYRSVDHKADADAVEKEIVDREGYKRYIHLRFKTKGDVTIENVHPFEFDTPDGKVLVFHNGTMQDWAPKLATDTRSDSKAFTEDFLAPLTSRMIGGMSSFSDPFVKAIIDKAVGGSYNRVLILTDLGDTYFGKWERVKLGDSEVLSSNDSYWRSSRYTSSRTYTGNGWNSNNSYRVYDSDSGVWKQGGVDQKKSTGVASPPSSQENKRNVLPANSQNNIADISTSVNTGTKQNIGKILYLLEDLSRENILFEKFAKRVDKMGSMTDTQKAELRHFIKNDPADEVVSSVGYLTKDEIIALFTESDETDWDAVSDTITLLSEYFTQSQYTTSVRMKELEQKLAREQKKNQDLQAKAERATKMIATLKNKPKASTKAA